MVQVLAQTVWFEFFWVQNIRPLHCITKREQPHRAQRFIHFGFCTQSCSHTIHFCPMRGEKKDDLLSQAKDFQGWTHELLAVQHVAVLHCQPYLLTATSQMFETTIGPPVTLWLQSPPWALTSRSANALSGSFPPVCTGRYHRQHATVAARMSTLQVIFDTPLCWCS